MSIFLKNSLLLLSENDNPILTMIRNWRQYFSYCDDTDKADDLNRKLTVMMSTATPLIKMEIMMMLIITYRRTSDIERTLVAN